VALLVHPAPVSQAGAGQSAGVEHELAPPQVTSHAHASAHSTPPAHAALPEQSTVQRVASPQSTPPAQLAVAEQWTTQGIPVGHVIVDEQEPVVEQSYVHAPSTQTPSVHAVSQSTGGGASGGGAASGAGIASSLAASPGRASSADRASSTDALFPVTPPRSKEHAQSASAARTSGIGKETINPR
jgi:hypothetical protein